MYISYDNNETVKKRRAIVENSKSLLIHSYIVGV